MGTTPHPPLHTIMQQWDAKPAPRTFPSLRPATTPRWSGTSGPSPTRRSLLCENNFNYTWILGKCKRKLFVKVNGQYPSGLVNSASSPNGVPFCAGFAREKASPSGEVAERQRWPEGFRAFPLLPACAVVCQHAGAGIVDITVRPCLVGHPVIDDHLGLTGIILLKNFTVQ